MIADIIVVASVALAGVFVTAWLVSPRLRTWIERPKHRFQDAVRQYDRAQHRQRHAREATRDMNASGAERPCPAIRDLLRRPSVPRSSASDCTGLRRAGRAQSTPRPAMATEEYGRRLVAHTAELLGPDHPDPDRRYIKQPARLRVVPSGHRHRAGHADAAADRRALSALLRPRRRDDGHRRPHQRVHAAQHERQAAADGQPGDDRDGVVPPIARRAIRRRWVPASKKRRSHLPFKTPNRAADLVDGEAVFDARCSICHGADGEGLLASEDARKGYLFPPLWGPNSYNNGAGMHAC